MADDAAEVPIEGLEGEDAPDTKKPGLARLVIIGVVCLVAGGALGFIVLSPRVAPMLADRAEASPAPEGGHGEAEAGGHGEEAAGAAAPAVIHLIENLVVNPARSRGSRFLLTSIAVQVSDPGQIALIEAKDVELRAALLLVLGSQTVDELADIEGRPALLDALRTSIETITGPGVVRAVYLPQFVIQ